MKRRTVRELAWGGVALSEMHRILGEYAARRPR
jgi:hypothetical protein